MTINLFEIIWHVIRAKTTKFLSGIIYQVFANEDKDLTFNVMEKKK